MDQSTSSANAHTLSKNQDRGNFLRKPIILRLTDKMFIGDGDVLNLKTTVILQAKTHPQEARLLFCESTNEYPSETKYGTTRLACVLEKNGIILWDHLIFSNAMIFPKSMNDIGDIEIKDNNGRLIEKIPVQIRKRKKDLNQSDNIIKRPPRRKEAPQNEAQTNIPNPEVNQTHQAQMMNIPLQNQTESSMPVTGGQKQDSYLIAGRQYQNPNLQHEHQRYQNQVQYSMPFTGGQYQDPNLQHEHQRYQKQFHYSVPVTGGQYQDSSLQYEHQQYQNQVQYSMPITRGQYQDPSLRNEHVQHQYMMSSHSRIEDPSNLQYMLPPTTANNRTDEVFQNQSATTAMNSYISQTGSSIEDTEMLTPTSSQSEITQDQNYYGFSLYQQQERLSRGSSSHPIQSFLTQPITDISFEEPFLPNDNEEFTDIDE